MHLAVKMIRESTIIVQATEIRATHVADLQFLVARRARGVGQCFKIPLLVFFRGLGDANLVVLGHGEGDAGCFTQDGDFEESDVDAVG